MAFRDIPAQPPPLPPHVLRAVGGMPSLTSLDLSRRRADARDLRALAARLPRLETLALHGCPLEADEVAALQRAFPSVNVLKRNHALDAAPELAVLLGTLSIT